MNRWQRRLALVLVGLPLAASSQSREIDLNAEIEDQCGAPGFSLDSGCKIQLGKGSFSISETIRIGECTTATVRPSIVFEGQSAGGMTIVPRFPTAGTTLRWKGPLGGTMIEVCGSSFVSFRDLTLDAANAGVGIRITADSRAAAISHFVELKSLVIDGAFVGVQVTGRNYTDQSDFVVLDRVSITNASIGYLQDSQQSVGGRLQNVEVTARNKGYEIRNGSLTCDGCYVGSLPADRNGPREFIGFHLTSGTNPRTPWEAHHQVHIEHSHMELKRGRFVVEDAGGGFPITLIGNSYSLQCPSPGCEMLVVDSQSNAPLVMIGDVVQASSNPPAAPRARVCHRGPELIHLGVHKKAEVADLIWTCGP